MAGIEGTGTPVGTNQDQSQGPAGTTGAGSPGAPRTPGEVLFVGQDKGHSAATGPNIDEAFYEAFVQPAFATAVEQPLRNRLIWDQFSSRKVSGAQDFAASRMLFLGEDIDPTGADKPLLENLDVDSVTFGVWSVGAKGDEYGRAVSRTRLANARTAINIDPMIVDRVAFDAARACNTLARNSFENAFNAGIVYTRGRAGATTTAKPASLTKVNGTPIAITPGTTVPTAAGDNTKVYLSSTAVQIAAAHLAQQNAMVFPDGNYILLTNQVGAQHLKNERDTGGFRYVTARNEGLGGNSTVRGMIGMTEGVNVVVANDVPNGVAYLIGRDAVAKTVLNSEGYGDQPSMIVAPQIDKLRRFLSWGWLHFVGYTPYDVRAMIAIEYENVWRPAGAAGIGADHKGFNSITATGGPSAEFLKFVKPSA